MKIRNSQHNWIQSKFGAFTKALYYELDQGGIDAKLQRSRYRVTNHCIKKELLLNNKLGIHARPAAMFIKIANRFSCDVFVEKDGERVNGKSVMGLMMLAAGPGSLITVYASGPDAAQCINELERLVTSNFGED